MRVDPELVKEIRESVHMHDVLEMLDMDLPRGGKIYAWDRPETEPSVHIYPDHWWDYGRGRGGDQIALVQEVAGVSFVRAVRFLAGNSSPLKVGRLQRSERELPDLTEFFNRLLPVDEPTQQSAELFSSLVRKRWPYLDEFTLLAFRSVKLTRTALWIAHRDVGGVVRGIKTRSLHTGAKKSVQGSVFTTALYTAGAPKYSDPTWCWLVEGESDAWCMEKWEGKDGAHVFALPSGAGTWRDEWVEQLRPYSMVRICFDYDEAGEEARKKVSDSLRAAGVPLTHIYAPEESRVAESLAAGWEPPL